MCCVFMCQRAACTQWLIPTELEGRTAFARMPIPALWRLLPSGTLDLPSLVLGRASFRRVTKPQLIQHVRLLPRLFTEVLVAIAGRKVARFKVHFDHNFVLVRLERAQFRCPLGRLPKGDAWIVQSGRDENVGIVLRLDVVVRGIRQHVVKVFVLIRIAPFLPFATGKWNAWVTHCVHHINKRYTRHSHLKQVGTHVENSTHEQSAGRSSFNRQFRRRRHPSVNQMLGARDKVGKRVALHEVLPLLLVPMPTHLPTTTNMRNRKHHSTIEVWQDFGVKPRVDANAVRSVTIQHGCDRFFRRRSFKKIFAHDHRNGHLLAIGSRGKRLLRSVQIAIKV
eukprot:m.181804 g.181804  ORF g.181804 m.181804 type:complete len:337 (+) comp15365_c0_seq1:11-1021(+)